MEEFYKAINDIIVTITDSFEYKRCLEIKEKMSKNKEIVDILSRIKVLQKKYVRSNYDKSIKEELDKLEEKLNSIPIYNIYLQNLEVVNEKIDYVKDSMNDYFYHLFN